jgi:hypothetical protein
MNIRVCRNNRRRRTDVKKPKLPSCLFRTSKRRTMLPGARPPLPGLLLEHDPAGGRCRGAARDRPAIDYRTDADRIAISFADYLSPHAFEVASRFRASENRHQGGKFISTFPDEAAPHFDSTLVGEAQTKSGCRWCDLVSGTTRGATWRRMSRLADIPRPLRLAESKYTCPIVVELPGGARTPAPTARSTSSARLTGCAPLRMS